jgi:hypothetical protein
MISIHLKECLTDKETEALAGSFLDESHYDQILREDAIVYKPDGGVLLILRRNILPLEMCRQAHRNLRKSATETNNRGLAGGVLNQDLIEKSRRNQPIGVRSKFRYRPLNTDGTLSKSNYANPVNSGVIGFYDRYPRIPYCRLTAFNMKHPEKFIKALPFIQAVNEVFKQNAPERYNAQLQMINITAPDFCIPKTVFTTITVNKNWQTAVHQDKGDYEKGFGVMSALRAGTYDGGFLVFPKYRIGVDLQMGDVILADVHEYHGNTKIKGKFGLYERLSCVFYYREHMHICGSAEQELERAKKYGTKHLSKAIHEI